MGNIEELINDPGNHTILKETAKTSSIEVEELSEKTGMKIERIKEKLKSLSEYELIDRKTDKFPTEAKLNREKLKQANNQIKQFEGNKRHILEKNLEEDTKKLSEVKEKLTEEKENKDSTKQGQSINEKIKVLENSLKINREAETNKELLEAHAVAHRALKHAANRDDFQNLNLWRKVKASRKIEDVLDHEPEDPRTQKFFGNRWITGNSN